MSTPSHTLSGKQAVLEALPDHPAIKALLKWNPQALTDAKFDFGELTLTIASTEIRAACSAVQAAGYNFFEDMTAVDWFPRSPRFQLSYHILSHAFKERIRLRVLLDEADPEVESITSVWPVRQLLRARSLRSLRHSLLPAIPISAASCCPTIGKAIPCARITPWRDTADEREARRACHRAPLSPKAPANAA